MRAGETFTVTDRGVPIARLVPIDEPAGLDGLIANGDATPGDGELLSTITAMGGPSKGASLSDRIESLRDDDR